MAVVTLTKIPAPVRIKNGVPSQFKEYSGTEYNADIEVGVSIRLYGSNQHQPFDKMFRIGDEAAVDYFNYAFTGKITKITKMTVTIEKRGSVRRLCIYEFASLNHNFDVDANNKQKMEFYD